ncbi:hypothetical protein EVA_06753 [gut metagenome]|uniref:Uncharacterized protein n=1 Tax=gut metagenome TaxID=749906 RepID=J9GE13_9ZZZZ
MRIEQLDGLHIFPIREHSSNFIHLFLKVLQTINCLFLFLFFLFLLLYFINIHIAQHVCCIIIQIISTHPTGPVDMFLNQIAFRMILIYSSILKTNKFTFLRQHKNKCNLLFFHTGRWQIIRAVIIII